jgi:hypothetical protein
MRSRIAAGLLAVAFSIGGVALSATAATADDKVDRVPVKCVNPAGKLPPGQQPECKGKAHDQIFKDDDRDKRDDKRDDKKKDDDEKDKGDRDKRDDKKKDDDKKDKGDRDKRDDKKDDDKKDDDC